MATPSGLYYDPATPSAFSNLQKLRAAAAFSWKVHKNTDAVRAWLKKQNTYTFHRPARKHFARNPYTATNVLDVWECDLLDVQTYAKFNDNHRYIL